MCTSRSIDQHSVGSLLIEMVLQHKVVSPPKTIHVYSEAAGKGTYHTYVGSPSAASPSGSRQAKTRDPFHASRRSLQTEVACFQRTNMSVGRRFREALGAASCLI